MVVGSVIKPFPQAMPGYLFAWPVLPNRKNAPGSIDSRAWTGEETKHYIEMLGLALVEKGVCHITCTDKMSHFNSMYDALNSPKPLPTALIAPM